MIKFGPKAQLTSIVDNWAPYYIERVKAVLDGTWKSSRHLGRPRRQDGRDGALHQHARRREEAGRGHRGRDHRRQAAAVQMPGHRARTARKSNARAATHLDDGQMLGMNFYVKGIDDKFPAK